MAKGCSVTTARRKMIVNPASRMLSAISFGVFCRSAPSTRAIMRSRKVSPGLAVILTLIRSDKTRVPPVTAERSPPASRMTGADSPVIADSSTEATPSIISPSEGINSPADTETRSPAASLELGTLSSWPLPSRRLAMVSERALRRVSACALPRPSAMASAKFANTTVNHSQNVICRLNLNAGPPLKSRAVVITLPISTTNMTGFPIILRGFNFRNASQTARLTIFHSQVAFFLRFIGDCPRRIDCTSGAAGRSVVTVIEKVPLKSLAGGHQQMLKDRTKAQGREKGQCAHNQDHADEKDSEQRCGHGEGT